MSYSREHLTELELSDVDRERGLVQIWDLMRGWRGLIDSPNHSPSESLGRIHEYADGTVTYEAWGKSPSINGRSVEQVLARLNYAVAQQFT